MRKLALVFGLSLFVSCLLSIKFDYAEVKATNGYPVHNIDTGLNYTTIQGAIGAPETLDGHTIFVENGTYYEHITIHKEISLIGENRDTTIIDGNGTGYVVTINYGQISGFTIRNGEYGVNFQGSYCKVDGNTIVSNSKHGIEVYSYFAATISNNLISSNGRCGIFAYGRFGDEEHEVKGNTIISNGWDDIALFASKCIIFDNVIGNLELWSDASETTVHSNWIGGGDVDSQNNLFYNNYFNGRLWFGSEASASFNIGKTFTESGNILGGPYLGGNFWTDYSGEDNDLDGIGDTPHGLGGYFSDSFPLVHENAIYLMADGSVFPSSAPIETSDNITYTLMQNINNSLLISRKNITFNGDGYTIQGAGDSEGIGLATCHSVIKDITVRGFKEGIKYHSSSYNTLFGSAITSNEIGICFHASSSNNSIRKNIISNNNDGVYFHNSSNYNTIRENTIIDNYYGIYFRNSSNYNIVHENVIANNTQAIKWISELTVPISFSHSNVFYHNNFIGNILRNWANENNTWDDGYPSGGNYWDDYTEIYPNATEIDDSGIWDTPYIVSWNGENVDNYPLIKPVTPTYPIPTILSATGAPDSIKLGDWATIVVKARNDGNEADEMYVSVSLPDNPPISNIELISHDLQDAYILPVGSEVWGDYGTTYPIVLDYPLVEGFKDNWETGETKTLQFKVKPQNPGTFRFFVKTTARINRNWGYDPQSGTEDQQNEYVYVGEINVQPDSIDLPVPYEAQGNAPWCYAASTAMILRYYGKPIHVWDIGQVLRSNWWLGQIESIIHEMYPGEFETKIGKYSTVSEETRKHIEGNLSRGYPVLLNVDPPGFTKLHNVVITGFNSSGFFINDPTIDRFFTGQENITYPYIHEFVTWEELQPLICPELFSSARFLVIEGTPKPLDATLFYQDGEKSIRTIHDSDNGKGVCVDYGGHDWYAAPYWKSLGWHPIVWDSKDTFRYAYEIFNHKSQEATFDFYIKIQGEDEIVYYENESLGISISAFGNKTVSAWDISLKHYLIEGQQYVVIAEICYQRSQETVDLIALPPIDYVVESIMFMANCPVRILVTDPDGLRVGFDHVSNQTVSEILDALYFYGNGSEPEVISIPNQKIGDYSVTVFGIEDGTYNLTRTSLDETGSLSTENLVNLSIKKNESQIHVFQSLPLDTTSQPAPFNIWIVAPIATVVAFATAIFLLRIRKKAKATANVNAIHRIWGSANREKATWLILSTLF